MADNLHQVILFLMDQTSKAAKRYSQREMDENGLGITVDQWVLLKIVEQFDGLTQKELAKKSLRDAASITRTLDLLQKKDLIRREADPNSRRQYLITLTKAGKAFIEAHMEMIQRHRANSLAGFSAVEVESLKSMLLRIQKNVE